MPLSNLPLLRQVRIAELADLPQQKIRTDDDIAAWQRTRGYRDYWLFLLRLNEAVVGYPIPHTDEPHSPVGHLKSSSTLAYLIPTRQ